MSGRALSPNDARAEAGIPRLCSCGCQESVRSSRPGARYATGACRTRAWKARTGYTDARRAQASRNGKHAAKRTRRKPSVRISYRKAVAAVAQWLEMDDDRGDESVALAEEILDPLLTPAARKGLR